MANSLTALVKPQIFETKTIKLTSPMLHIGSSVTELAPFEFVQANGQIYLPNLDALARAFKESQPKALIRADPLARPKPNQRQNTGHQANNMLNEFLKVIESREQNLLVQLLEKAFGANWWEKKDSLGRFIFPEEYICEDWVNGSISKLRPMIRDGFGKLYIPGSSIKGAIRTAIAYYMLKHENPSKLSEIESTLKQRLEKLAETSQKFNKPKKFSDRDKKNMDSNLFMDRLFSDFSLCYQGREAQGKTSNPNTDFMRSIHVSDSRSLTFLAPQNKSVVADVLVSSRDSNDKAKWKSCISTEMVVNVETDFEINLDQEMLKWFRRKDNIRIPFSTIDEILTICMEFAQDQWRNEGIYWNSIHNNFDAKKQSLDFSSLKTLYQEPCPYQLRLGWASGMLGTTVNLLLDESLVQDIRDTCGLAAPNFKAPKSRRTVINQDRDIEYPLGWVNLEVQT